MPAAVSSSALMSQLLQGSLTQPEDPHTCLYARSVPTCICAGECLCFLTQLLAMHASGLDHLM